MKIGKLPLYSLRGIVHLKSLKLPLQFHYFHKTRLALKHSFAYCFSYTDQLVIFGTYTCPLIHYPEEAILQYLHDYNTMHTSSTSSPLHFSSQELFSSHYRLSESFLILPRMDIGLLHVDFLFFHTNTSDPPRRQLSMHQMGNASIPLQPHHRIVTWFLPCHTHIQMPSPQFNMHTNLITYG